jgi:hypothetical protein
MSLKGNSLVGIIVAVAIVILLTIVFTVGSKALTGKDAHPRPDGKGETLVGKSIYTAKDEVCREHLRQVRMSIQIKTDAVDNSAPQSIEETGLGQDFYKCPVGGEPYAYDPQTGQVKCVHPGHEKY